MGWKTNILPDSVLKRLPPDERKKLGKAGVTQAEADVKADTRLERELQRDMENLLNQREIWHVRSRMDKKTSLRRGVPDFMVVLPGGRALFVEAKAGRGTTSEDQDKEFERIKEKTGLSVWVVTSLPAFQHILDVFTCPTK